MGSDSAVAITAGTGTNIDTFVLASGDHQQVVREARATAVGSINTWDVTTVAVIAQIAADNNRVFVLMTNASTVRVYLRLDATAPTASVHHWYLDPGDRWEVPKELCQLQVSMVASTAGSGKMCSLLATAS